MGTFGSGQIRNSRTGEQTFGPGGINKRWAAMWQAQDPGLQRPTHPVYQRIATVLRGIRRDHFPGDDGLRRFYAFLLWWWSYKVPRIRQATGAPIVAVDPAPLWGCIAEFLRWERETAEWVAQVQAQMVADPQDPYLDAYFLAVIRVCENYQDPEADTGWQAPSHWTR